MGITGYYFPNAFTPNHDGINDEFGVIGPEYIKEIKLKIYNRWGMKVFEISDKSQVWTASEAQPGIYVYKGYLRDIYNRYKEVEGVIEVAK